MRIRIIISFLIVFSVDGFCQSSAYSPVIPVVIRRTEGYSNLVKIQSSNLGARILAKDSILTEPKTRQSTSPESELEYLKVKSFPKYFSLVIGVSEYKFSDENLVDLENPTSDAESLYETLRQYSFNEENSKLLRNPTRAEIIDELERFSHLITEKDNFLIFYAGHGFWDDHLNVGYWLPADAQAERKSTWISNSSLKDYIAGIKAKHIVLISDACFSGSIFKSREITDPLSEYGVSKLYQLSSRKAMTSGNLNTTPDKSIFFEYLNRRLNQNESKYLSSRDLFHGIYNAVINNTRTVPQYGVIQDTGDEGGEFIFIRSKD